ncbi:MAG: PAS domain S-box protein [Acidobacteriia bacterium]|nr:PAS domain S-box protein [Terriglobia bacterium]
MTDTNANTIDDQVRAGGAVHASGGASSWLTPQANELRVLHVEDDPLDAELVAQALRKGGFSFSVVVVQTEADFERELRAHPPDVVLADYNLPQWKGMEALDVLRREGLDVPLILVSGALGDVTAVECIKRGATDYVLKDGLARLPEAIRRALQEEVLRERQRRSDAALRESQAQLEDLVHSAMDAILTVDEEQNIVMFNAAAEKMFRCSRAVGLGQPIERFIPQRFRVAHSVHIRKFGETSATNRAMNKLGTLRALRADGEEFPMEASISRIQVGGRLLFTVIVRDITERDRAEKKLAEKMAELARSNANLEQFAYVASHDLQEPLRMVAAYTQLLAERYRGKLDENAVKYIGYASEGALRMQSLIQDLLAFSRVGRNGDACGHVDCEAVMEEVLLTLGPAIQESGAVVTHGALPVVWTDRSQIVQVLQNLVGNAIKFHGKEPPVISVQAEKTGDQWLFSVVDNGIGIAPEFVESIFTVFQRLHTRSEYPGNGIGLAICKKIVEHYGGKIWVESQVSRGSIFKFTIPCGDPAEKELCDEEMAVSRP